MSEDADAVDIDFSSSCKCLGSDLNHSRIERLHCVLDRSDVGLKNLLSEFLCIIREADILVDEFDRLDEVLSKSELKLLITSVA